MYYLVNLVPGELRRDTKSPQTNCPTSAAVVKLLQEKVGQIKRLRISKCHSM